jgi:hypothetical protein
MSRPLVALTALGCLLSASILLAGCGSSGRRSSSSQPPTHAAQTTPAAGGSSLESLAGAHPIGIVPATQDYQPGVNRTAFLIIDAKSRAIVTPTARVWVATSLTAAPYEQTTAKSELIGVPGGSQAPAGSIYVAHVTLPRPGKYWLLAIPSGGTAHVSALGNLVVPATPAGAPWIGDRAIPSHTPTLASTGEKLAVLSTATHPDPRLYRVSVAQALATHVPFVVTFATPRFCTSRTCGPTVDVVDAVAKKLAATPVRFIHVEIYRGNDPAKGFNRWVKEWHLPTEPFTFVVDRNGVIRAKLEGAFSVSELERTVREQLLRSPSAPKNTTAARG